MTDEKRKEVLDLLLKKGDFQKVIEDNLPLHLYKYRFGKPWDLSALESDSIWIANACKMDDPFDSKLMFTDKFQSQIEYAVNHVEQFMDEKYRVHLKHNAIQKDCFLCSFSEVDNSEDMWQRYADNERGICIEYDTKELLDKLGFPLLPVYYNEKQQYDAKMIASLNKEEVIFKTLLVKDKVGIKGEDWYSQREWRILAFRDTLGLGDADIGKCIQITKPTRVILGKNILEDVTKRILVWKEKEENKNVIIEQR